MNKIYKNLIWLAVIAMMLVWFSPFLVQAGTVPIAPENPVILEVGIGGFNNVTRGIAQYIGQIYVFATAIVGGLAVVMIIIGAVQYSTSAGNKAALGSAKETITSAIIGLVIVLMAYLILGTFSGSFVNLTNPRLDVITIPKTSTNVPDPETCMWQGYSGTPHCIDSTYSISTDTTKCSGTGGTEQVCCCQSTNRPKPYTYKKCGPNNICVEDQASQYTPNQCDTLNAICSGEGLAECVYTSEVDAQAGCYHGYSHVGNYWCCKPAPPGFCKTEGIGCIPNAGECCSGLNCPSGTSKCVKNSTPGNQSCEQRGSDPNQCSADSKCQSCVLPFSGRKCVDTGTCESRQKASCNADDTCSPAPICAGTPITEECRRNMNEYKDVACTGCPSVKLKTDAEGKTLVCCSGD